jgi:hypothetical protein
MFLTLFAILSAVFTGSGVVRLDSAKDRIEKEKRTYDKTHGLLQEQASHHSQLIRSLALVASKGVRDIVRAEKMLSPLTASWGEIRLDLPGAESGNSLALRNANALSTEFYAAAGVATGLATAGALWCGASVLGIASTGMPIVFLQGAALHNAALACLGGGALAAGGGGMVVGGAVIASAVVVPAALFLGWKTHSEANRLNQISDELAAANKVNIALLAKAEKTKARLVEIEAELGFETARFRASVVSARRQLFRLGVFTHWFRLLRASWWGTYYSSADLEFTDLLASATLRYTDLFDRYRQEKFS